jgi:hypothetical protein
MLVTLHEPGKHKISDDISKPKYVGQSVQNRHMPFVDVLVKTCEDYVFQMFSRSVCCSAQTKCIVTTAFNQTHRTIIPMNANIASISSHNYILYIHIYKHLVI